MKIEINVGDWGLRLGFGIRIGNWGIGIGDLDWGFGIWDWDWGLRFWIGICDWGLGSGNGIGDWDCTVYFILMRIMKFISFLQYILQLVLCLFGGCVFAGLLKN